MIWHKNVTSLFYVVRLRMPIPNYKAKEFFPATEKTKENIVNIENISIIDLLVLFFSAITEHNQNSSSNENRNAQNVHFHNNNV